MGLPFAISAPGVGIGFALILLAGLMNYITMILLIKSSDESGYFDYFDMSKKMGKKFTLFVKIVFFLNNMGMTVGYTKLVNVYLTKTVVVLFPNTLPD